jgi:hypothetical protein
MSTRYYGVQNEVKAYCNRLQNETSIVVTPSVLKALNDRVESLKRSGVWSQFGLGFNDVDGDAYLSRASVTDIIGRAEVLWFTRGIKSLGLWNNMVSWPLRSYQNTGTGSTVRSLGGFGTFDGTMVNGPSWSIDGITFGSNTQYIQYSPNFTVDFTRGGYSVHAVWSGLGVSVIPSTDLYHLFSSSDNSIRNEITTGVGGGTTWLPQSRNYNGLRYWNNINQPVVGNIGYGWNADTLTLQRDGSDLSMGSTASSTPTNGSYTMRTTGRNNSTTSATSRVSYLIAFPPSIGMTAQRLNLIYNLSRQTLGNGLGLP